MKRNILFAIALLVTMNVAAQTTKEVYVGYELSLVVISFIERSIDIDAACWGFGLIVDAVSEKQASDDFGLRC